MACTKKFLLWSGITSSVITYDLRFAHGCDFSNGPVTQNKV
jgi:hypothetical protein